ncbi:MAG: hypothetical protein RJQ14_10635 [Marinoscillum sp.]
MKTKIFVVVLAMALFACGGESKSSETTEAESTMDSVVAEVDTAMTAVIDSVEADMDSMSAEIDSTTVE